MRFAIAGKIYQAADVEDLSLRDMLLFEKETAELGVPMTWDQIIAWHGEIEALETDAERASHPRSLTLTACAIWASRRAAGEPVTFSEAIDIPARSVTVLPDTADRKPKKAATGKAGARKASGPRAGSAAATPSGSDSTS